MANIKYYQLKLLNAKIVAIAAELNLIQMQIATVRMCENKSRFLFQSAGVLETQSLDVGIIIVGIMCRRGRRKGEWGTCRQMEMHISGLSEVFFRFSQI